MRSVIKSAPASAFGMWPLPLPLPVRVLNYDESHIVDVLH